MRPSSNATRSRPWSRRLALLFAPLALLAALPGCYSSLPDLPRETVTVTAGDVDWDVSFMTAGDPHAQRIIYVHGTPGSGRSLLNYLHHPEPGFEHLVYDRPGFGLTTPRQPLTSFAAQARILEPFLVSRDGCGVILVGHSLGGPIIAEAAALWPDRIAGLVIVAGSLDPDLERLRWYNHVADWAIIRWLLPRSLRHSNREVAEAKAETERLASHLSDIRCPIMIVHGDDDGLVPIANVDYMLEHLNNAEVDTIIIGGGSHFIPWTDEPLIRDAIRRLAARTRPPVTAGP